MKLVDMKVEEFVSVLGSSSPAPGGGSASALAGAIGASLTIMVCELTIGKEKYLEHEELMKDIKTKMKELCNLFKTSIDKDTDAFNAVSAVFSMPKETDEDKALRRQAMQDALKQATIVPYEVMELAAKALELTHAAVGKSNSNAASDLGVSALNLKSSLQGAWLNVLINLSSVKDEAFVSEYQEKGQRLLDENCKLADEIYKTILTLL